MSPVRKEKIFAAAAYKSGFCLAGGRTGFSVIGGFCLAGGRRMARRFSYGVSIRVFSGIGDFCLAGGAEYPDGVAAFVSMGLRVFYPAEG